MEKIYGKGLLGFYNSDGQIEITPQKLKAARRRPTQSYAEVGGIMLNMETATAFAYGLIDGLQYSGLNELEANEGELVESNCFYSTYGLLDSVDLLVYDVETIVDPYGELKWMNMIMYNPMHIMNNGLVEYEMCEMYTQMERLVNIFSLDWALIAQFLSNDLVYVLTEGMLAFGEFASIMQCSNAADEIEEEGMEIQFESSTD